DDRTARCAAARDDRDQRAQLLVREARKKRHRFQDRRRNRGGTRRHRLFPLVMGVNDPTMLAESLPYTFRMDNPNLPSLRHSRLVILGSGPAGYTAAVYA